MRLGLGVVGLVALDLDVVVGLEVGLDLGLGLEVGDRVGVRGCGLDSASSSWAASISASVVTAASSVVSVSGASPASPVSRSAETPSTEIDSVSGSALSVVHWSDTLMTYFLLVFAG